MDVPETYVLLDGYTRSVVFMREAPADGRLSWDAPWREKRAPTKI